MGAEEFDRPILITGAPRSGKTTVHRILERSPDVFSVWEPVMIWDAGLRPGRDDRRDAADATDVVKRRIRSRIARMVHESGKARYQDNLAHHALRVPFVHAVLPEARIIHVVRDGRAVVPELMHAWGATDSPVSIVKRRARNVDIRSLPPLVVRFVVNQVLRRVRGYGVSFGPRVPTDAQRRGADLVTRVSWQWAQLVRIAHSDLEHLPAESRLEVRFEDVIADPVAAAQRMTRFAESEDPGSCIRFAERYVAGFQAPPPRRELTDAEWETAEAVMTPVLRELGYE